MNNKILKTIGILAIILLVLMLVFSPNTLIYDEVFFYPNLSLYEKNGLSKTFLVQMQNQAPGPLYQILHHGCKFITHLEIKNMRLLNYFLVIFLFLNIIFIFNKHNIDNALAKALILFSIPFVWPIFGLSLTEVPPMACCIFAISLLVVYLENRKLIYLILCGFFLGLACLGRSQFVLVPLSMAMVFVFNFILYKKIEKHFILPVIIALITCVPIFLIWNGLQPPLSAHTQAAGFAIWHGILALAYSFMATLIIKPNFLNLLKVGTLISAIVASFLCFFICNYFYLQIEFLPMMGTLSKIFSANLIKIIAICVPSLFFAFGVLYILWFCVYLNSKKNNTTQFFIGISFILIVLSCFKIGHLFSSRYIAQASFLLILFVGLDTENQKTTKLQIIISLAGIFLGVLSLKSYYW